MVAGPLIVIVGETGSGKSKLAMQIAKAYGGEIICADAWTIRKGMDIGTAKPTKHEQEEIPHHMLDLIYPDEDFSAADFQKKVGVVIKAIHKRNKIPILVGGNGLYIDGVVYNYSFLTTESTLPRRELNNMTVNQLMNVVKSEHINPEGVDQSNKRRLIRLIETKGQKAHRHNIGKSTVIIGLSTNSERLEKQLRSRLNNMMKAGLDDEVRRLSKRYGWGLEALKGVGYREWQDYFSGSINKQEVKERILKNSLHLAKKQRTWFKRNKDIHWITTPVNWQTVVDLLTTNNIIVV